MKYNTIYYFGIGHLHNKYVGVDGGSNIRLPLMSEFLKQGVNVKWLGHGPEKTFTNHYLSAFNIGASNLTTCDLRDKVVVTDDVTEEGVLFIELRPNISKPGYSFEAEWNRQIELIETFHSRHLPVFVWDQDGWAENLSRDLLDKFILLTPYKYKIEGSCQKEFHYSTTREYDYINAQKMFDVVYCGNVYGRREEFLKLFNKFDNDRDKVVVTGNWLRKDYGDRDFSLDNFPHFMWIGPSEHWSTIPLLSKARFTLQANNPLQQKLGMATVRLFEAHMAGTLPITNRHIQNIDEFVPEELLASDADEAYAVYTKLSSSPSAYSATWKKFHEKMKVHLVSERVKQLFGLIEEYDKNRISTAV